MIRIYTREGLPPASYDTDSFGLDRAESILRADGIYRIQSLTPGREGETIIPAREVIRIEQINDEETR
ncbi:MAG TPA: hypothetical protein VI172_17215 [Candidatus Dormibacteraeota bacterium]